MIKTLKFRSRDCVFAAASLLEKIQNETRQVQAEANNNNNESRYEILVHRVTFSIPLAEALGKLISSLACRTDDRQDGTSSCCKIAKLDIYRCRGFSAPVVAALFPASTTKANASMMIESLHICLYSMVELNSFLAHVPKRPVRLAHVWKIWPPPIIWPIVTPEDAQIFAHHLARVHGICQLYLAAYSSKIVGGQQITHLALLLADDMASLPHMTIHVVDSGLLDTTAAKIIGMLSRRSMHDIITRIALRSCCLQEETFSALGQWLVHPGCRLKSLDLSNQDVGGSGLYYRPFFETLARQVTIKHLNMTGNFLDDSFARDVAHVLCQNTSLESWKLSQNRFGRIGMETLVNALKLAGENLRMVELLGYREMLERGWTGMFVDALKANPRLLSVTLHNQGEGSLPAAPDPPRLIQEYHYYLALNKAGRPYFYLFEGEEATSPPVTTTSPLPLALWPHLLARAARISSEVASEGDHIYRMLRDGPLVQELRNLRASRRTNISRKRRRS